MVLFLVAKRTGIMLNVIPNMGSRVTPTSDFPEKIDGVPKAGMSC
jgi:hypothetical protein